MCNYVVSFCLCAFWVLSVTCQLYEGDVCVSESRKGQCVNVRRCRSALNNIKLKRPPQLCSFNGKEPIICCTDSALVNDTSVISVSKNKPGQKARDNCIKYLTGTHYGCTLIRNRTEISSPSPPASPGLRDAVPNEYPHMALLGYGPEWDSAQWKCGGSVISERFVLTTATCKRTLESGSVKFVALGIMKRSEIPHTPKEQRYEVKNIVFHPEYVNPIKYHDIALLEVSPRIQFNSISIKPACLALESTADTADALSFGSLGRGRGEELANNLQVMHFSKFSDEVCYDAYPIYRNMPNGFDPKIQDCFGDRKNITYTCSSDYGGPLQLRLNIARGPTSKPCGDEIIGLISLGSPCPRGPFSSAGIFTHVPYYVPWIESVVWP